MIWLLVYGDVARYLARAFEVGPACARCLSHSGLLVAPCEYSAPFGLRPIPKFQSMLNAKNAYTATQQRIPPDPLFVGIRWVPSISFPRGLAARSYYQRPVAKRAKTGPDEWSKATF